MRQMWRRAVEASAPLVALRRSACEAFLRGQKFRIWTEERTALDTFAGPIYTNNPPRKHGASSYRSHAPDQGQEADTRSQAKAQRGRPRDSAKGRRRTGPEGRSNHFRGSSSEQRDSRWTFSNTLHHFDGYSKEGYPSRAEGLRHPWSSKDW